MPKTPDPDQVSRFKQAARELSCDEDPAHFEEKLKKVAAHKPSAKEVSKTSDDDGYFVDEPIDVEKLPTAPTKTGNINPDEGLRPRARQSKPGASSRQTKRSGRK